MATTHIKQIEIHNLDLNTTASITKDGTLEKSHNVRYSTNGIENMCNFTIKERINNTNGFKIIHIHNNSYIAIDSALNIHHVEITLYSIISKQMIESNTSNITPTINHFGNILIITHHDRQSQYLLKNNSYTKLNTSALNSLDTAQITYTYKTSKPYDSKTSSLVLGYNSPTEINKEYITTTSEITGADHIYGAFYMIFAYRLMDGSIIKASRAIMALSESKSDTGNALIKRKKDIQFPDGKTYKYAYCKTIVGCQPTITFNIDPKTINHDLISSIVIFATRPEQIYDFGTLHSKFSSYIVTETDADLTLNANLFHESSLSDYAKKPFYEIEEITLGSSFSGEVKTTLTWNKHFKEIEHNTIYTPSFSVHDTIHRKMMEYNGRLHTFNQTTKFYNGTALTISTPTYKHGNTIYDKTPLPEGYALLFTTIISTGTSCIELHAQPCTHYYYHNFDQSPTRDGNPYIVPIDNFVSYPDHRAQSINIYLTRNNQRQLLKQLPLTSSLANNIAYYNNTSSTNYSSIDAFKFDLTNFIPTQTTPTEENSYTTTNKIMVSQQNNPFVFEPKNCYDIDTEQCEIYSITTAADQINENSFGQHPLLVFTSKGIFTIEQGSGEVLYSRTVLLNKETQYPNTQNLSLGGIVFYTTENEVRAITSRNSNCVSKVLEPSLDSTSGSDNIFQFLKQSRLCSVAWYDEIMLLNSNYPYAYIYSIKSNSWSTRNLSATFINQNTLIENQNIISINLREDQARPLLPHICTNALKLSTPHLKKIEYLAPQISTKPDSPLTTTIWASNNLREWYIVGSSEFGFKVGRCGASWRYFKVELKALGTPTADYYLYAWAIEIKYTIKYIDIVK